MKKHTSILLFSLISLLQTTAQNAPWNAKFIVHHPAGLTDTVWFGCDTAGNWGYQTGLDSIDTTSFQAPISILAYDSIVEEEFNTPDCTNLKRDVKGFKSGVVKFDFYVLSDSSDNNGLAQITWDTSEFKYKSLDYELTYAFIRSTYGGLVSIDNTIKGIYSNYDSSNSPFFHVNNAYLISENAVFECNSNKHIIKLSLITGFNDWLPTSISVGNFQPSFSCFPNPSPQSINIQFYKPITGSLIVFDNTGATIQKKRINNCLFKTINIRQKGVYFISIINEDNEIIGNTKVLII